MNQISPIQSFDESVGLKFLWIELTQRCNLSCVHCYADSSPTVRDSNPLSVEERLLVIEEAHRNGCHAVQFIGGEPTLDPSLPVLINHAASLGFSTIEVFTNLISIKDRLLELFVQFKVHIATSIYADTADIHDMITNQRGSWKKTVSNLKRCLGLDLPTRVSVIEMPTNTHRVSATVKWLNSLGVLDVGVDRTREFGRGGKGACRMDELCGECSGGTLCIGPDGSVSPCIMSKSWQVGSVRDQALTEILHSQTLRETRKDIYASTLGSFTEMSGCNPDRINPCQPNQGGPCTPCGPNTRCGPNACRPS